MHEYLLKDNSDQVPNNRTFLYLSEFKLCKLISSKKSKSSIRTYISRLLPIFSGLNLGLELPISYSATIFSKLEEWFPASIYEDYCRHQKSQ